MGDMMNTCMAQCCFWCGEINPGKDSQPSHTMAQRCANFLAIPPRLTLTLDALRTWVTLNVVISNVYLGRKNVVISNVAIAVKIFFLGGGERIPIQVLANGTRVPRYASAWNAIYILCIQFVSLKHLM